MSAVFQCQAEFGARIRVAFDGEEPVLPPAPAEGRDAEPDWYPDEIYPDD